METPAFLVDQLAAERSVSAAMARRALYLKGLADEGCSLRSATDKLGLARSGVQRLCRKFMIDLSDYRPYARRREKGEEIAATSRNIRKPAEDLPIFEGLRAA